MTGNPKIDPTELTLNDKLIYINRVAKVVKGGKRLSFSALVVTGGNIKRAKPLLEPLNKTGMQVVTFAVSEEPTIQLTLEGVKLASHRDCNVVIGMGGGSVIDAAKAIAALLSNSGDIMDYLEVIGRGQPLTQPPAPCIAVPSTGTS